MAFKFKELFLNTYDVTGTLDGAVVRATVKTKTPFEAVALLEKEISPGSKWTGVHLVVKSTDRLSLGFLVVSIIVFSGSLIYLAGTNAFSGNIALQYFCGFSLSYLIMTSGREVFRKLKKVSQPVK